MGLAMRVRVMHKFSKSMRETPAYLDNRIEFPLADISSAEACRKMCEGMHLMLQLAALVSVLKSCMIQERASRSIWAGWRMSSPRLGMLACGEWSTLCHPASIRNIRDLPKQGSREGCPLSPFVLSNRMGGEYR